VRTHEPSLFNQCKLHYTTVLDLNMCIGAKHGLNLRMYWTYELVKKSQQSRGLLSTRKLFPVRKSCVFYDDTSTTILPFMPVQKSVASTQGSYGPVTRNRVWNRTRNSLLRGCGHRCWTYELVEKSQQSRGLLSTGKLFSVRKSRDDYFDDMKE